MSHQMTVCGVTFSVHPLLLYIGLKNITNATALCYMGKKQEATLPMTASSFDSWLVSLTSVIPSCGATVMMSSLYQTEKKVRNSKLSKMIMLRAWALPWLGGQLCGHQHSFFLLFNRWEVTNWLRNRDDHHLTHLSFWGNHRRNSHGTVTHSIPELWIPEEK